MAGIHKRSQQVLQVEDSGIIYVAKVIDGHVKRILFVSMRKAAEIAELPEGNLRALLASSSLRVHIENGTQYISLSELHQWMKDRAESVTLNNGNISAEPLDHRLDLSRVSVSVIRDVILEECGYDPINHESAYFTRGGRLAFEAFVYLLHNDLGLRRSQIRDAMGIRSRTYVHEAVYRFGNLVSSRTLVASQLSAIRRGIEAQALLRKKDEPNNAGRCLKELQALREQIAKTRFFFFFRIARTMSHAMDILGLREDELKNTCERFNLTRELRSLPRGTSRSISRKDIVREALRNSRTVAEAARILGITDKGLEAECELYGFSDEFKRLAKVGPSAKSNRRRVLTRPSRPVTSERERIQRILRNSSDADSAVHNLKLETLADLSAVCREHNLTDDLLLLLS